MLFLIGYRGTGKTTVAQRLAERLHCAWVDADVELERRAGKTIAQIFAEQGETSFRDLESKVVAELATRENTIVALGGGAVLREENRRAITGKGLIVWLQADAQTLFDRIHSDPTTAERRPNLTAQGGLHEIEEVLRQREPIYRDTADLALDTAHHSPDQIAEMILRHLAQWPPVGDSA